MFKDTLIREPNSTVPNEPCNFKIVVLTRDSKILKTSLDMRLKKIIVLNVTMHTGLRIVGVHIMVGPLYDKYCERASLKSSDYQGKA